MQPLAIRPPSAFSLTRQPASRQRLTPQVSHSRGSPRVLKNEPSEDAEEVTKDTTVQSLLFFWYELPVLNLKPCNAYDFFYYYDQYVLMLFFWVRFHGTLLRWTNIVVEILTKRKKIIEQKNIFLWKIENLHLDGIVMRLRKRIWRLSTNTDVKLGPVVLVELRGSLPLISKVWQCLTVVWILQCNNQLNYVICCRRSFINGSVRLLIGLHVLPQR